MKRLLAAGLTIALLSCTAKTDKNTNIQQFVLPGWRVIQTDIGDLNQDGLGDAVLVVEENSPGNLKQNDGMGVDKLNLNRRHLIVLLKTSSGFRKAVEATRFLPSENSSDNPCLSDPMDNAGEDSVQILGGLLKVSLQYWSSCGSWETSNHEFKFRHENGRFRLIGFDTFSHMRNSGEATSYSTNFLTGKQKVITENVFDPDVSIETGWKSIVGARKFYLDEMSSECQIGTKGHDWCK